MARNWGCVQEHLTVEHREFGLTVLVPLLSLKKFQSYENCFLPRNTKFCSHDRPMNSDLNQITYIHLMH